MPTTTPGHGRVRRAVAVAASVAVLLTVAALAPTGAAGGAPTPSAAAQAGGEPRGHPSETSMDPIPPQYPFVCTVAREGLGQPKIDNQDGQGIPVAREDANGDYPKDGRGYPTAAAEIIGWSRDCEVDPVVEYRYRSTGGQILPLDDPTAPLPADIATATTTDGDTAAYVIRYERGTINRFIYSVAMLAPTTETDPLDPQHDLWNGRLLFHFGGGVAIGRSQGRIGLGDATYDAALSKGYAVMTSTGTNTSTHYNLTVGGQTAVLTKQHFVDVHGEPLYTVGLGGSGGGIQQYVYAQNHPDLLDGGVPQYSYPDMITQTTHVGDCELLEHYFESTDADNPRWTDVEERELIEGLNGERAPRNLSSGDIQQWSLVYGFLYPGLGATPPATATGAPTPGLTECRAAWYGLTPLVLNPTFTTVSDLDKLAEGTEGVEWTHGADAVNVYGTDPQTGYARNPWDNVGVQYGIDALASGEITPEEFLDLNAQVGSWKEPEDMVEEGCPFIQSTCANAAEHDPWSSRQMNLSPDDGVTPAPRREGDVIAMRRAYEKGLVFRGAADIPFIDWRHFLEEELDMHNSSQSFATRQRMVLEQGNHDNQVIWMTDARPARAFDQTPQALEVLHDWITNIQADPAAGVGANRPASAVDSCFATDGTLLHSGGDVWDGVMDSGPEGPCTSVMTPRSTSRRMAGGPITGTVFKCQTKSVAEAVADGDYGAWSPSAEQVDRLEVVFPSGVCDYSLTDLGDPRVDGQLPPNEAFVRRAFYDLAGEAPSAEELSAAVGALDSGTGTRRDVARALVGAEAVRRRTVTQAYQQVLGRDPDDAGRDYWVGRLGAGLTRTALVANLLNSGEAYALGGATPEGFVDLAYEVLLGRPADDAGRDHWVAALEAGARRWYLARAVLGSTESREGRVEGAYVGLLGRVPDAGGLAYWTDELRRRDDLDLVVALVASAEYLARATSGE